jgi:signal transduction histidine kinase
MLILIVDLSVCAGAAVAFAAWPLAALSFLLPATLPYAATAPFAAYALQRGATPLMGLFVLGLASLTLAGGRRFRAAIVARLAAEAAQREQAALMAAAGHDLRQPLQSVRLFVGALLAQGLPPAARSLGERLEAAVDGLDAQFTALLDLTRLDAGLIAPDLAPTPLGPLLARVSETFAPQAAERGLRLRVAPSRRVVVTDRALLERILANLIDNALGCAASGGVLVGARQEGRATRIEVWDTGPGVPAVDRVRIFEPYVRLRSSAGGLGLGLAIVRRTAHILGARVEVRRSSPRGSCFSVTLPERVTSPMS